MSDSRSTALHTDRYELTMLDAALRDGTADRRCVFELFGRRLSAGRRFGVIICYEDTDPYLARQYGRRDDGEPPADVLHRILFNWGQAQFPTATGEPAADFLVNISNDGWFDGTSEHEEHLAISRFRAVECRRTIVRSVNMGISAVIDGNGQVLAPRVLPESRTVPMWVVGDDARELPIAEWGNFKKSLGVLRTYVPIDRRSSLYAQTGDVLPGACWAMIVGAFCWSIATRRRQVAT